MKKVIIIGAGLAGSQAAYYLQADCEVVIYTKEKRQDCNSMLAQGGIAAAIDKNDHWQTHYQDTLKAGVEHNQPEATELLVREGINDLEALIQDGMHFDTTAAGDFQYGLEGAHSRARILHCHGDQTGKYVTLFMQKRLQTICWKENCMVSELLLDETGCCGIRYLDQSNKVQEDFADAVVLATGGLGQLYPLTSNDRTITGDGMALARRAGAVLADMEFVQFHPTLLTIDGKCYGLISEAVRGAGGYLIDENGTSLLADYPLKDLSPRDVVARVLTQAYNEGHQVFLAIDRIENFEEKFPQIAKNLEQHQIPFKNEQLIPVRPGAHFMMGGIQTDINGLTTIPQLYAVGEVACTGVHGANRLASNSLLECLVFGRRSAKAIMAAEKIGKKTTPVQPNRRAFSLPKRSLLQEKAWDFLGIERTGKDIQRFLLWLSEYQYQNLPEEYSVEEMESADLCLTAEAIARAALKRTQSIGAHFRKEA